MSSLGEAQKQYLQSSSQSFFPSDASLSSLLDFSFSSTAVPELLLPSSSFRSAAWELLVLLSLLCLSLVVCAGEEPSVSSSFVGGGGSCVCLAEEDTSVSSSFRGAGGSSLSLIRSLSFSSSLPSSFFLDGSCFSAATAAAAEERRARGAPLVPRGPKLTNRGTGLAPLWGRRRSQGVRKRRREMHRLYVQDRRLLRAQV